MDSNPNKLYPNIYALCTAYERTFDVIPEDRRRILIKLSEYITEKLKAKQIPQIITICTHNSRRSHLAQLWLSVGADFYQLPLIRTYSGGTLATALNFRVVEGLLNTGFTIGTTDTNKENPVYQVQWRTGMSPALMSSKVYDAGINPKDKFAAVMVCDQADEGCPVVSGCDLRIALPFEDPKSAYGTPEEEKAYEDSIKQIGREMLFVTSQVRTA